MKLEQLHADADLLRRHSLPLAAAHRAIADAELPPAASDWPHDVRPAQRGSDAQQATSPDWSADALHIADAMDMSSSAASSLPPLFAADDENWPPPPPPTEAAKARASWIERLAQAAAASSVLARRDVAGMGDADAANGATRRQLNLAPWLAAGVIGIVLLALAAGLVSHQRVDAEAAQLVEAKRKAAEQALSLLHAADRSASGAPPRPPEALPGGTPSASEPAPRSAADLPADGRARHDAMLASIKGGTVLASLPPSALAQPSALPADLPPANVTAAGAMRNSAAPVAVRPAKKVALVVEGTSAAAARRPQPADPLAVAAVRGTLKGAATPQHRVYQLRESDGEWLGFVARADADPLAAGVWTGSGDPLAGGWRVAEVTSQRVTLVGADGTLEILRP